MLLARERVEVIQFSDNGPPSDSAMLDTDSFGSSALGWVTLGPATDSPGDPFAGRSLSVASGETLNMQTLLDYSVESLGLTTADFPGGSLSPEDRALYSTAQEVSADVLISARTSLAASALGNGVLPIRTPAASVPLVALYLRSAGDLIRAISPRLTEMSQPASTFFQSTVNTYCPSLTLLAQHSAQLTQPDRSALLNGAQRKLASALARRDNVWRLVLQHPTVAELNELADDVDVALVQMTSALDATARYLDAVLGLRTHRTKIGFQRPDWRDRLSDQLGFHFSDEQVLATRAVTGLRNFVHAGGKRTVPIDTGAHQWKRTTTYLVHDWEDPDLSGGMQDPAEALQALASGIFGTPANDIFRTEAIPGIFIAPGPALDSLSGATMHLLECVLAAYAASIPVVAMPEAPALRVRPEIRRHQTLQMMGIPGFGGSAYLA